MTGIDIAILAILLISALFAFSRGFTRETIAIFAWIGTGVGTYVVFPLAQPLAHVSIPIGWLADGVALFVVFSGFLTVSSYVSSALATRFKGGAPGVIDRSLGFGFGLARGLVVVATVFLFLGYADLDRNPPEYVVEANFFPLVDTTARTLTAFVPQAGLGGASGVALNDDPTYEAPQDATEEDGYADSERRALDQLIESTSSD